MGLGMACRLAESGFEMAVYNRTRAKAEEVGELGARIADSPADAASNADIVMLSLADQSVVENMLTGVQMPALAEAVVFGERAGLPREAILQMINGSGYSSPVMNFRCAMMEGRRFENAAFKLSLMRKDMMLVLQESQELGVPMPVAESAYSMLTAAKQQGLGDLDVAAILAL